MKPKFYLFVFVLIYSIICTFVIATDEDEEIIDLNDLLNKANDNAELASRRQFVVNMTKHAWDGYVKYAWGDAYLKPWSRSNSSCPLPGQTIYDSMSTLHVMGLNASFEQAQEWVLQQMDLELMNRTCKFERHQWAAMVGSLLSMYSQTNNSVYLVKAKTIADRVVNHQNNEKDDVLSTWSNTKLEFRYLSNLTGDVKYDKFVENIENDIAQVIEDRGESKALVDSDGNILTLRVKSFMQSYAKDKHEIEQYHRLLHSLEAKGHFDYNSSLTGFMAEPDKYEVKLSFKLCNLGIMIGMAEIASNTATCNEEYDFDSNVYINLPEKYTDTCYWGVKNGTQYGIPKEYFRFNSNTSRILHQSPYSNGLWYLENYQIAESYFLLWRQTLNPKYREYAWELAQSIEAHARHENGYSNTEFGISWDDKQMPLFISATLKYLYLTFCLDNVLPSYQWIINAAGQPLPMLK